MKVKKDKKAQKQLVYLLSIYLNSGFSMQSSFQLIQRGKQLSPQYLAQIEKMLCTGTELEEIFRTLHFSPQIIAQIQLAQIHGNLPLTLASIYQQLKLRQERLQKMQQILFYPVLLLVFLLGMLLLMRFILLPQFIETGMVSKKQGMIFLLWYAPNILVGVCGISVLGYILQKSLWRRLPVLQKVQYYCRIPGIKALIQLYYTSFFASEWGLLLQQGLELRQIILCMQQLEQHSFMHELSRDVAKKLSVGLTLQQALADEVFFTPEFTQILFQGEMTGDLGKELTIYSRLSLENFQQKLQQGMQWIQPVVFFFVAVLVLGMYLSILMPIYSQIGQFS